MLEIALNETEDGVYQKDIADRQDISVKYLDTIISGLKTSGLIVNKRGRKSGYILTRKPEKIRMLDIYNAFEPGVVIVDCIEKNYVCTLAKLCGAREFWLGLNDVIENYFSSYTLEDLINEHRSKVQ